MKLLTIAYSIACYLFGFASLVALILFVGGVALPWSLDTGTPLSLGLSGVSAVAVNLGLILAWGSQHSIMADSKFKRVWTLIVPAAVERSTYVFVVGLFTFGLMALWSPLDLVFWDFEGTWLGSTMLIGYFLGWAITLFSTFLINHFQLFGLQQAWEHLKSMPSKEETFVTPLLYKLVRHPMMTGVLMALWCAPILTLGRLTLNLGLTAYILMGLRHEEKTLVEDLGDEYRTYQRSTPMLVPGLRKGSAK